MCSGPYTVWFCSAVSCVSCRLTDRELHCQGLNSSCKRPAAPRHAPLLPRWLEDIPAALWRSAHEESVMEWLCEPPGSISWCTTATLLRLRPCGLNAQLWDRILLPPMPVYQWEGAQMVVSSEKPSMQQGLRMEGPGESTCYAQPGMLLKSVSKWSRKVRQLSLTA